MNKELFGSYVSQAKSLGLNNYKIGRMLHEQFPETSVTAWRKRVDRVTQKQSLMGENEKTIGEQFYQENDLENETVTDTNQYDDEPPMSALKPDGKLMTVQEYCEHYGLPADFARTAKLVAHTGVPRYNIASNILSKESDLLSVDEFKSLISKDLSAYTYVPPINREHNRKIIVVKIADLHFGAYIDNLIKTKKFSIGILAELLNEAANIVNSQNAEEVHIHIHGDLIESFTGLNHKNSWKGLQKSMVGAEVVKLCTKVIHTEFLGKIYNLGDVKIVAGNHDRVTSAKDEDTDGDAASLIAWGLELMGYKIQFDPLVIQHVVDGICYVLLHGDKGLSSRPTKAIIWDYGKQGMYNVVAEGHLHALIEKQSLKKNDKKEEVVITRDDSVDNIRMTLRSFFTGNSFSEYLGYTSNSGFSIITNNGKGVPNIFHFAI